MLLLLRTSRLHVAMLMRRLLLLGHLTQPVRVGLLVVPVAVHLGLLTVPVVVAAALIGTMLVRVRILLLLLVIKVVLVKGRLDALEVERVHVADGIDGNLGLLALDHGCER